MFTARVRGLERTSFSIFKKLSASFLVLVLLSFNLVTPTLADQYGQYGTTENYTIRAEKFVAKPNSDNYVENLASSDLKHKPNQNVKFKVVITNTSDVKLKNVQVKDFFPAFLDTYNGYGTVDGVNRTISFTIDSIEAKESKTFYFTFHIVSQEKLPANQGILCLTNKVWTEAQGVSSEDSSQFCIEKEVIGVKTQPSAGPDYGLALLGLNAITLISGIKLMKKGN